MKKAFAVAVVATIAATTTEGANLRAHPTKTLLARCANGATSYYLILDFLEIWLLRLG
jgi:hypothetical protein